MSQPPNIPPLNSSVDLDRTFFKEAAQYFDYLITIIGKEPKLLYNHHLTELSKAHKFLNALKMYALSKRDKRLMKNDLQAAANGLGETIERLKFTYGIQKTYASREFRNAIDVVLAALFKLKQNYEEYDSNI
jgi:hypothetical protein